MKIKIRLLNGELKWVVYGIDNLWTPKFPVKLSPKPHIEIDGEICILIFEIEEEKENVLVVPNS